MREAGIKTTIQNEKTLPPSSPAKYVKGAVLATTKAVTKKTPYPKEGDVDWSSRDVTLDKGTKCRALRIRKRKPTLIVIPISPRM